MANGVINGPVITVTGNPITSYNPRIENHLIADQNITDSTGYLAQIYDGIEYRQYFHRNSAGDVVRIDPWVQV